ncbi:hypothetical protein Chor_002145 [Crotalus horridus]
MQCQPWRFLPVGFRLSWAWKNVGCRRVSQLRGAMRLVQFQAKGSTEARIGLEERDGGDVVDLNAFDPSLPRTMRAFLEAGEAALAAARRAQQSGCPPLPRSEVALLAPITSPDKVICVGMNYVDHCLEQNVKIPKEPIIFSKFVTLYPGDVFLTGTPPGVGFFRKPPIFLKRGDEVQCEIDELGTICNKVM